MSLSPRYERRLKRLLRTPPPPMILRANLSADEIAEFKTFWQLHAEEHPIVIVPADPR